LNETLRNFYEDLQNNKAPDTRKIYTDRFKDIMRFLSNPNTDQFLTMDKRVFEDKVHMYIRDRHQQGKGHSFLNQAVSAMRLFCIANRIDLNFTWLYSKIPKPEASEDETEIRQDEPYSKEQLAKLFDLATEKKNLRAICSMGIMFTGGPRIGALPRIRIENLAYVEKYDLYAMRGYPESKKFRYWILTAPWLKPYIDQYKGERKDGRLFISHINDEPVKKGALVKEIWRLLIESGIRKPNKDGDTSTRHETMLDHGFRKAFSTACEAAGLNDNSIAHLRGMKDRLAKIYQLPNPIEVIESTNYMQAVPRLEIVKAVMSR
jgi:hypothetical protein